MSTKLKPRSFKAAGAMLIGAACFGAVVAGAAWGHTLLERDTATPPSVVITPSAQPSSAQPSEAAPSRDEAYATYLEVYGEGNGCVEDFDANFKGFVRYDELPEALQQQVAEDALAMHDEPFLEDYEDGSVLTVRSTPDYLVYLGAYDGACEEK